MAFWKVYVKVGFGMYEMLKNDFQLSLKKKEVFYFKLVYSLPEKYD